MAAYVELYMDQGATFSNVINLTDDVTNDVINITGYTVRSQMRRSYYSTNPSANITCTITNAANGEVTLTLPATATANLKAGRYLFDVQTIDTSNNVVRILEGIMTVTPRITI
jgi:hypothetical protein